MRRNCLADSDQLGRDLLLQPLTHSIKASDFHPSSLAISPHSRKTGHGEDVPKGKVGTALPI